MKSLMRLPSLLLVGASLLATLPVAAQLNDGKPDPDYTVPERLDLDYALAYALDNNFTIRQAKERIRQQEGILLEVRSGLIPNVSAGAGYSRNSDDVSSNGRDYAWSVDITARQILYAGGGVTANVRSQQLALEAATLALRAVINDALVDVRIRFFTVLLNREKIKVQEQNTELLQRQLQDVKNRFEAGTVSNFEVLRAEVALANAQPALISARNDYRLGIEELRQALGYVAESEPNVAKVPEFLGTLEFKPTTFDLRSALGAAREQRPDLLRLAKLTAAAEEGIVRSRAGRLPSVSAFGSYDWRRSPISSPRSSLDGWTVGLQSSWDIFDGRATTGRIAQARSFLEQTKLALAEAQLSVDVEVRRAISTFQQATELAEASKKVVEQAEEAVRLANARYAAGTATQLDVLTSQVDLTTARLNQVQAYYSHNVAVASVRNAMGLADEAFPTKELTYP
ncbi:Outer membrane protein TolC precursor [Lacunisphaera limnophila]|uniref:Outer membrane protein TolC n=1 Tax=Lacunisphaera limnophila TaxID=1838286 RepID=A0A1D8AZA2_9BACT|nr:TolC family protein [Lacunisphaera limnophila]AOS46226.1 Outer membrane protein TolC precursor [Lacunisphaera limnophila]